jgi:hypothetical protein
VLQLQDWLRNALPIAVDELMPSVRRESGITGP